MRPRQAVVKSTRGPWMELLLHSGAVIRSIHHPSLAAGDVCWFTWDYTRSRINMVMTADEYESLFSGPVDEPEEIELGFDDELGPEYWPPDDGLGSFSDPCCERVWR